MLSTADDATYHFRPPMKQKKLNSTAQPLAFSVGTFNLLGHWSNLEFAPLGSKIGCPRKGV